MIADSLTNNNITTNAGSLYIPAEFGIFGEHSVVYHKVSEIAEAKPINQSDYIVKNGIATGICIYFLVILLISSGRILNICRMFINYRFAKKQYEETGRINAMNTLHIVLFTVIIVSIQFSLINNYQEYKLAAVPFLTLYGIFIVQSAALKLLAMICKSENVFGEIHLNRKMYFSMLGMVIWPLTITALLYPNPEIEQTVFMISKIVVGIVMLAMAIRILRIFSVAKISCFFRFLYLCAFEISPYLALFIVFENIN
jgi:hypothetical protein